jgi:hypothetical protein
MHPAQQPKRTQLIIALQVGVRADALAALFD